MKNIYFRRPYSIIQEEISYHKRSCDTGIIIGAEPFYYKGSKKEAVLMIHGYTSTPRDLRRLGRKISELGYEVSGILLPGHGTKPTDLDDIKWIDWFKKVEQEFLRLKEIFETVHAVGFSMGGTLAMHLALKYKVGKIVLLSPFFKIAYNKYHVIPEEWLVYTIGRLLRHLKKRYSGNCSDIDQRKEHIAYFHYSLSTINNALELVEYIIIHINKIKNPVLFIHSKNDRTTSPSKSRSIFKLLSSEYKRFVWLKKSNHIITHDYDKKKVFKEVLDFFS